MNKTLKFIEKDFSVHNERVNTVESLNISTLGQRFTDSAVQIVTKTVNFIELSSTMGHTKSDHNYQLITLTVITSTCFRCSLQEKG